MTNSRWQSLTPIGLFFLELREIEILGDKKTPHFQNFVQGLSRKAFTGWTSNFSNLTYQTRANFAPSFSTLFFRGKCGNATERGDAAGAPERVLFSFQQAFTLKSDCPEIGFNAW